MINPIIHFRGADLFKLLKVFNYYINIYINMNMIKKLHYE
jgi:hypothetical protein